MYARSSAVRGNPEKMDEAIAYVHDKVMPAMQQMDGCVGLSMLCDRDSGMSIVTSSWADHEAMTRNTENVRGIREHFAQILGGPAEVREWEIAALHRMHGAPQGACCRVVWMRGVMGQMDSMLDTFRMAMLPRMEELPGFCSVSLMVDRQSGISSSTVTYEGRDAMMRAAEQAQAMREEFSRQLDQQVTDVQEFELVLAHLRVPEKV
jgi:quinol monooxygenase YgiN